MDAEPINNLKSLWEWKPPKEKVPVNRLRNFSKRHGPELLVCHDMKGGYLEEESLSGYCVPSHSVPYVFLHWWQIDTFCYFSHHMVTVPPTGWTNCAHLHGVRVLGTFITESNSGESICSEMLKNDENINRTVEQLVFIAKEWNFEGWLINIENDLKEDEVPKMCQFLRKLTDDMRKVFRHSQVIWYDAVTMSGELSWQNALNKENEIFYNNCDGIYLNYNWDEELLLESVKFSEKRGSHSVYGGVDVFARGCVGGWDCATSFSLLNKHALSVALFAPGWVAEKMPDQEPISNGMKFWSLLFPYTNSRPITELPFGTDFSTGFKHEGKWWCLDAISMQPHFATLDNACIPLKETRGLFLPDMATYRIFTLSVHLDPTWEIFVRSSSPVSLLLNDVVVEGKPVSVKDQEDIVECERIIKDSKSESSSVHPILSSMRVHSLHISTLSTDTILYEVKVRQRS